MAAAGTGRLVSQLELSIIVGVTPLTIRTWEGRGCPVLERGGKGKSSVYNTADVIHWREDQITLALAGNAAAVDYEEAKRRRMVAEATLAEIEVDLRKGEVVLVDDVVTRVVSEYAAVRNKLLNIGARIAPRAAVLRLAEEVKALIDAEVAIALAELTEDKRHITKAAA